MMRLILVLASLTAFFGLMLSSRASSSGSSPLASNALGGQAAQELQKPPDTVQLAAESKLGTVAFSHTNHITKNYNITGTGPVECIECHHVEQPAAEVAKHPPLKTAWPADRTTTLTLELLKDPKAPDVTACRSCHARAGAKPQVWPEIPQIKYEGGTALITMTNQQAFHRNCAGCHDAAGKERAVKAPKTTQCAACHKKAA